MSREQIPITSATMTTDTSSSGNTLAKRDASADLTTRRFITATGGGIRNVGDQTRGFVAKTANYTVTDGDDIVHGDTTSGSFTVTLPAAAVSEGRVFTVVKIVSANTLTIQGSGAELINGSNTLAMTTQYTSKTVHCNGVVWYVLSS